MPNIRPVASSSGSPIAAAIPKSTTFDPPGVTMMLPGVTSRCTTPCRCASVSAAATSAQIRTAYRHGSGPWSSRDCNDSPSSSSITTNGRTAWPGPRASP